MNCHAHEGIRPSARCTRCGVLLCAICRETKDGRAVCSNCAKGGGEVVRALKITAVPVPPAMPVTLPRTPIHVPNSPVVVSPRDPRVVDPSPAPTPPAARQPRPAVAGFLGAVPGLGHLYAGKPLRGILILAVAPVAALAALHGTIPIAAYAFFHGLAAFDGYRIARARSGAWTREDSREARGIWAACAATLLLLGFAHAAGAPFSPWLAFPAVLVPLGVGLALGERTNRVNRHCELTPAPPGEPAPGKNIDRRANRAALAEQLSV